jgi:hypothetical protein
VSQDAEDVAVNVHPLLGVTDRAPDVAFLFTDRLSGLTANAQLVVPACVTLLVVPACVTLLVVPDCVTLTVRPATRKVPVRAFAPVLLDTENVTEPSGRPSPVSAARLRCSLTPTHPLVVVIATVELPGDDGSDTVSGETV